jgi:hypothetical protein
MSSIRSPRAAAAACVLALLASTSAAQAAITVYTTQAAYDAAISAPGTDTFNDISITGTTPSPLNRTAGAYTYTATTVDSFFGAGSPADAWLSTNLAADPITLGSFAGGTVRGVGGFFFTSDIAGAAATGDITLAVTDSLGATANVTITGTTPASFRGFVSDGTITSVVVSAVQAGPIWPTINDLTLGTGGIVATPPQFAYTPAAGSTVTATGGGAVGSTGALTITPSIGTAGAGTGAAATTTLTCTAPTAPFTGFGQTVTAIGAGAISGGPLSGSCTLGAAAATQTLTCNENRGGTANARTWTLNCPAGAALPLTSNPASGATVNAPGAIQVSNPNASPATVTCTAPAAPFSASPLSLAVPANGSASIQVSIGGVTPGSFTGTLNCTVGGSAQTLSFSLAGQVVAAPVAVPTGSPSGLALMALLLLLAGLGAFQLQRRS